MMKREAKVAEFRLIRVDFHFFTFSMDPPSSGIQEPFDLIRLSLSERVFVKLRGDREITGILHVCVITAFFVCSVYLYYVQAYDGHMNLILSDVEETIMLVDTNEPTAANGNAVIKVCA